MSQLPTEAKDPMEGWSNEQKLVPILSKQHPIDGLVGEVFMELGGKEFLRDWAEANPSKFIALALRQKPIQQAPAPVVINKGSNQLVIRIENTLGRSILDDDNIVQVI